MEAPCERAEAYVTAENVLLHCDALLERSPMLQALRQDPRGGELFVQPSELGALCTYVRIIGADWGKQPGAANCEAAGQFYQPGGF